jgi:hypothetical protein
MENNTLTMMSPFRYKSVRYKITVRCNALQSWGIIETWRKLFQEITVPESEFLLFLDILGVSRRPRPVKGAGAPKQKSTGYYKLM